MLNLPAAQRYELLKTWSLPTAGRKSIRYYVGGAPANIPPEIFVKRLSFPESRTVNTLLLLADAAKEAGKIDELKAAATSFAKDKVENAELLEVLVQLVIGKGKEAEPVVKAYAQAVQKRLTKKPEIPLGSQMYSYPGYVQPVIYHPSEYLFATLCLNDPVLANYGEDLLATMQATPLNGFDGTSLRKVRDDLNAKRAGAPKALSAATPQHWQTSTGKTNWIADDGYVTSVLDNQPSTLLFDSPLTGTFEFSVDSWPLASGGPGYGGLIFHPGANQVESVVTGDTIQPNQNTPFQGNYYPQSVAAAMAAGQWQQAGTKQTGFGRLTLQVAPDKIRCLSDGKVFYEDTDPAPTSPWLSLNAAAIYRNVSISGKPEVPTEIKLTVGDYLEGWQGFVYGGSLPKRLVARQKALGTNPIVYNRWAAQNDDDEVVLDTGDPVYDWLAKDGEIRGRKLDWPGEKASPSCLAYFRPLQSGEKVRYEFFFEPGKTNVSPSLGRVAFLFEPDGLKLHWMTDLQGDDWTSLKLDNAIGPVTGSNGQKLNLQPGAWNTASVAINNDSATIELNGAVVYEAKLSQLDERKFGFFHYRDKSDVRIRNVVLAGNWPKNPASAENLSLAAKPSTPAEVKVRRSVMSESLFASEASLLLDRARKLPAKERFDVLAAWVLPNERRPTYQLAGLLKPRDVLGIVDQKQQPAGRRVLLGGKLDLPCLEMIAAAKESGNLDALCARLAKPNSPSEDELDRRARLAIGAAALAAKGDDKAASVNLRELLTYLVKMKLDAPGRERWPDLIAGHGAVDLPALYEPALALLQAANKNLEEAVTNEKPFEQRDWWLRAFREVRARAELKHLAEAERPNVGGESRFVHWVSVPTIHDRAMGAGVPHWLLRDGAVVHLPGHSEDYLIFDTPLRGEFEVSCELKLGGWEELSVRYGSHQFELQRDRKHYKLQTNVIGGARESLIVPLACRQRWAPISFG